MDIPHSEKRFAGFAKDGKQLDADVHRKYIYGGHVAGYMRVRMGILDFLLSGQYASLNLLPNSLFSVTCLDSHGG